MAYDFHGSWSQTAGHHAQLFSPSPDEASGSAAVEYVLSLGFPTKKILLGVPVYGRSFLGASKHGDAYHGTAGEEGTFEYKELPRPEAHETVDTQRVAATCIGGDGGFVSYDNVQTVKLKGEFCKKRKLGVCVASSVFAVANQYSGTLLLDWYCRCARTEESCGGWFQSFAFIIAYE